MSSIRSWERQKRRREDSGDRARRRDVAGIELQLSQQLTVVFICILGGIGTAGVPAGSIPVVVMILGMVGIPAEGIGMILGVDRFLDMCRTTLNVTGDLAAAVVVSRGEGEFVEMEGT